MSANGGAPERDFGQLLHELRSREVARIPPGARTVLSGGVPNTYYFHWFEGHYSSAVERHIAVEPFVEPPPDLPAHIEWVGGGLDDLGAVETASVDLVFAGQVIEHLWSGDVVAFLAEAHRVLAPGGRLVLDSVNRRVTADQGWVHPEHTVEFTVDEIGEVLALAGFDTDALRGVWLCYDRDAHRTLPVDLPDADGADDRWRSDAAEDRPEDCMIWWAEARRADRDPDRQRLEELVGAIADRFRRDALQRLSAPIGRRVRRAPGEEMVVAEAEEPGYLVDGPRRPVPAGAWRARYRVGCTIGPEAERALTGWEPVGSIDVVAGDESRGVAHRVVTVADVGCDGVLHPIDLEFCLPTTTMGMRFRVHSNGAFPVRARLAVDLVPLDAVATRAPSRVPSRLPRRPLKLRMAHPNLGIRRLLRRVRGAGPGL